MELVKQYNWTCLPQLDLCLGSLGEDLCDRFEGDLGRFLCVLLRTKLESQCNKCMVVFEQALY